MQMFMQQTPPLINNDLRQRPAISAANVPKNVPTHFMSQIAQEEL